jgi:hypothetical protein
MPLSGRALARSCGFFKSSQDLFAVVAASIFNSILCVARASILITMAASTAALAPALEKKPQGVDLYSRFALAGALGCSVTHGAFTPVDVYALPSTSHV